MKFKSPNNSNTQIVLLTGHSTIVTPEGNEIDPMFQREAVALGCVPVGIETFVKAKEQPVFDRKQLIKDAINAMLDGGKEGDFNNDGKPDRRSLNSRVGFAVSREELEAMWDADFANLDKAD